jgi:hypothetical protein
MSTSSKNVIFFLYQFRPTHPNLANMTREALQCCFSPSVNRFLWMIDETFENLEPISSRFSKSLVLDLIWVGHDCSIQFSIKKINYDEIFMKNLWTTVWQRVKHIIKHFWGAFKNSFFFVRIIENIFFWRFSCKSWSFKRNLTNISKNSQSKTFWWS